MLVNPVTGLFDLLGLLSLSGLSCLPGGYPIGTPLSISISIDCRRPSQLLPSLQPGSWYQGCSETITFFLGRDWAPMLSSFPKFLSQFAGLVQTYILVHLQH